MTIEQEFGLAEIAGWADFEIASGRLILAVPDQGMREASDMKIGIERTVRHRMAISVDEAAAALGIGRNTAYEICRRGDMPCVRIGRRLVVPLGALESWLATASGSRVPGCSNDGSS